MLTGRLVAWGWNARPTGFSGCRRRPNCVHTLPAAAPRWELEALLAAGGSRYHLFQFLKRLTVSKAFLAEVEVMLTVGEARFPLNFARLLTVADMYSWNSDCRGLERVRELAEREFAGEYEEHGMLRANASLCENIDEPLKAMNIQMAMASRGAWPLASVLGQVELLLNKVLLCRSRAVVSKVYDCVRDFRCPVVGGPLLCSTWLSFFTSPYRSDWELADRLLEANEAAMLPHLDSSLPHLAGHLLDGRQLNRYCVLLQSFSKSSHRLRTKKLVEQLFLHFYTVNNVNGCASCIRLSQDLKLQLSPDITYKYDTMRKVWPQRMSNPKDMLYRF